MSIFAPPPVLRQYGLALACTIAAGLIRLAFQPWMDGRVPFLMFLPAVLFSAWYGGLGPGLLSTVLGLVLGLAFMLPHFAWQVHGLDNLLSFLVYLLSAALIVGLAASERIAQERAAFHARQATMEHERLAALIEGSEDAIFTKTLDGIITSWNKGAERLYGYASEEVIGKPLSLLVPAERQEELACILDSLKQGEPVKPFETLRKRKDGSLVEVSVSISPIKDNAGCVIAASTIARNISERTRIESLVREREMRLRAIVETAVDAIITINDQGIIETVNLATERMFGYSSEEMIGKNVSMLMPSPYREEHDAYLAYYRATGERKIIGIGREVEAQRKDGSVFPLDLAVSEINLKGKRLFTGIIRDITERKRHQREIEVLNAHLQRAMQETHHRVKNNLQVMAAMVELLLSSHGEQVPASEIKRIGQQILSLAAIHNLLTQQAKAGGDMESIDARQALEKLLPVLQAVLGERPLTFEADTAFILVQQATSLAVLANEMVSNAVKHGEGPIDLNFSVQEGQACLSVGDRVPGFPEGF